MLSETLKIVDVIFAEFSAKNPAPSLVYGVTQREKVVHWGRISRETPNDAISTTTMEESVLEMQFQIASLTKSFTAAAVLILRDEGKIDLDATLSKYLDASLQLCSVLSKATIRQLLSMTADLPTDDPWADRSVGFSHDEFSSLLSGEYSNAGLPGGTFSYSNLGYIALGRLISTVCSQSACTFIEERIFTPIGMTKTSWNPAKAVTGFCSHGFALDENRWTPQVELKSIADGAVFGGIWSSLKDIATWTHFLACRRDGPLGVYNSVLNVSKRCFCFSNWVVCFREDRLGKTIRGQISSWSHIIT